MDHNSQLIETARKWIGVRWVHQGRSRQQGVDCVGLCHCVATECGISVPDIQGYSRRQDGSALMALLNTSLASIPVRAAGVGDIAVFKDMGYPVHMGILSCQSGTATVIHAHARRRQVLEEALAPYGQPFACFRILKGEK
ncbi:C40 family peptidase [Sneathiella aquimaris]|uniref:C40 family peptidase n=1 Tax=Sneathiella aquimaris TaxID=2599305 RepID=UPI00146A9A2E|nr:NlpC/P60 family protein [Sneathiella aquimaris]